ncbi:MAG TPA: hypothetical protein VHO48_05630 [Anaerolineaceae bacterium]|nr:hypothetical protein [Anaerolineaceae bacterium]
MEHRFRSIQEKLARLYVETERGEAGLFRWLEANQRTLSYTLPLLAAGLYLISLPLIDPNGMTDIGLLAVLPATYYLGLLVLLISYCLLVFQQPQRTWLLFLHLVILIVMIHATPAIRYGTLRYAWAWKHVGIVDYIQRHGSVNPDISFLNAYHNWPGFFALNAMLTEAAGLESPLAYASWAPLFFNLVFLGSLWLVFRSLSTDRRLVWLAVWFFFLTDWVGQDYFAPQAFAYFFYLIIIGILLNWFRSSSAPEERQIRRWVRAPRLSRLLRDLFQRSASRAIAPGSTPGQRVGLVSIAILLMAVISFSHQLTPVMVIVALALLALFQLVYLRNVPGLMAVLTTAWVWWMATSFVSDNVQSMLASFGMVEENVSENLIDLARASPGQVIVSLMGRGLTLGMMALGGLGFIRRLRNGYLDLAAILLVIAPYVMLLANSYGGEILFRVYFFALPFLAFYAAGLVYPTITRRTWAAPLLAAALSLMMLVGFLFGYYGKEQQYYFSPDEATAAEYLFENAEPGSLIIEGSRNYPTLFRNYELFTYVPIAREPVESREEIVRQPIETLTRWMADEEYPNAYLIITRSMKAEIDMVGVMPVGSLTYIEAVLKQSDRFEVFYSNPDATIFTLKDRHR